MSQQIKKNHDTEATDPKPIKPPLSISEIGALLAKHYKLHDGLFDVAIEFKIGFGAIGPSPEEILPGAVVGVSKIGLIPVTETSPMTIDAAKINPERKKTEK